MRLLTIPVPTIVNAPVSGRTPLIILFGLLAMLSSCCLTIKEEHLGNNLYLSEYDNVDRRILHSKEECSESGTEIIAKSGSKRTNSNFKYWIIRNNDDAEPTAHDVKASLLGPLDEKAFYEEMTNRRITLKLKEIE